jgi:hypothetical protein
MKEHLMEEIRTAPTRPRRHRWVVAGLLVPAALLATLGAAKVIEARQVELSDRVGCYDAASLDANTTGVVVASGSTPADACATVWRTGEVVPNEESAPRLVSCVGQGDMLAWVFPLPHPQGCDALGLPALLDRDGRPIAARAADPVPPGQAERKATAEALGAAIDERLPGMSDLTGCLPLAKVEPIVRDELRRRGMTGWEVVIAPELRKPFGSREVTQDGQRERHTGPCTLVDLDTKGERVLLDLSTDVTYIEEPGGPAPEPSPGG